MNPATDRAQAWAMAAKLQTTIASENPARVPSQSMSRPARTRPTA